jgi:hypothetical protein
MRIRVKPDTVQLPHKLSRGPVEFIFSPSAEVPDSFAEALLRTTPEIYERADGPDPDLKLYKFKEQFKKQSMLEVYEKLDDAGKLAVFEFAIAVQEGKPIPLGAPTAPATGLSDDAVTLANTFDTLSEAAKARVLGYVQKTLAKEE